jgi:flap endonuclease-1
MGIPNLIAFLRKKAPAAFRRAKPEDLLNKRVGVDLSVTLYRGAAGAHKYGPLAHLEALLREVRWLLDCGCRPFYVVDGIPPIEKAEEAQRRSEVRSEVVRRLEAAQFQLQTNPGDAAALETVQKLQRQNVQLTPQMRLDSKALLEALGIPCIQAPGEAERCLAHLLKAESLDVVLTEDVDVLVCGAPAYIKNSARLMYEMDDEERGAERFAEVVELEAVLAGLELSYTGFVTMAVLAGCDFVPKLPRMGPATAWKHVKRVSEDMSECLEALKVKDDALCDRFCRAHTLLRHDAAVEWPEASEDQPLSVERLEDLCARLEADGSVAALRAYARDIVVHQTKLQTSGSPRSPKRLKSC